MSTNEITPIYEEDYDHLFEGTIKQDSSAQDISGFTTKQLYLVNPSGTAAAKTASFKTDGTDGILQYRTVSGDFPVGSAGVWKVYARVSKNDGQITTLYKQFRVYARLD